MKIHRKLLREKYGIKDDARGIGEVAGPHSSPADPYYSNPGKTGLTDADWILISFCLICILVCMACGLFLMMGK